MKVIFLLAGLLLSSLAHTQDLPDVPSLNSKAYLLLDFDSKQVLLAQNSNTRMEPASLTKLMTAYLTFTAIKKGTLKLDQILTVPIDAPRNNNGESRMLHRRL